MHDPVEIRKRIDKVLERVARRDDYGALLARGDVIRRIGEVEDPDHWRSEIRRQARADRIRVRTGQQDAIVYAVLSDGATPQRRAEGDRYRRLLEVMTPAAVALRHEPSVLVRDGDEAVLRCDRCPALAVGDATDGVIGGSLLDDACPHENDPRPTALGFMYGS